MGIDTRQNFWRSVWNGYVFWTLFTSLPAMIWFYPLNELEISGYEVFISILLIPSILRFARIRRFFQSDTVDSLLKFICIAGILSFRCPTTLTRLCVLTIATGSALVKFVSDLTLPDMAKTKYVFWGYSTGFMAVLCSRICYRSIMPAFHDDTTNLLVAFITFLNAVASLISFESPSITPSSKSSANKETKNEEKLSANFLLISLGMGSLFYVMHAIFGEVSTPIRWINGPRPNNVDPEPLPWSLAIYFALLFGFYLSSHMQLVFSPIWSMSAAGAFFVMYSATGWPGFVGVLILAIYVTSIWPTYVDLLFRKLPTEKIGPAIALSMSIYVMASLYSVWTVAYNFVPGGEYTRESTGRLIFVLTLFMTLGIYWHEPSKFANLNDHLAFTNVGNAVKMSRGRIWKRFALLAIFSTSAIAWRFGAWNPGLKISNDQPQNNLTTMIWTYHFGYDNRGWPSLERTKKLIENLQADVIGLLETDSSRLYMGNNDLAQWLAENLQMYVDFGPNTRKHTWGSLLLSRFPILESQHHLLPSPEGELAPAISAVLNVTGTSIGVVITHFGNDRDDEDRKLQANTIAKITSDFYARNIPSIFLGYVTSKPYSRDYFTLLDSGRMFDIDESDQNRFCEYIFYNGLHRLAYARVSHGGLSDTEIQIAKFKIPDSKVKLADFRDDYEKLEIDASKIPENQRLPKVFGEFYKGHYRKIDHHYHMFTPKYFLKFK